MYGVAPDAQLLVMKVFGKGGGAYDWDYMASIEDAILLGSDSVNLSIGSPNPGMATNSVYKNLLESLHNTDTVVTISAGNNYAWPIKSNTPAKALYAEDNNMNFVGSPGSYDALLTVASVDNHGYTGELLHIGNLDVQYMEPHFNNESISTLDKSSDGTGTTYDYVFMDGIGLESDYKDVDVTGKVVFISHGSISFLEKQTRAQEKGAIAAIIYNNSPGLISMALTDGQATIPTVSISKDDGNAIRSASVGAAGIYSGKLKFLKLFLPFINSSKHEHASSLFNISVFGGVKITRD
ncbi:Minor extracellular protease vpr precursor [compost metagenome]